MRQSGQTMLIVVLVMVVALTVSLAIAARSITNLRVSSEEANSEKAFQAAEAGIEEVIKSGQPITIAEDLGNNAYITAVTKTDLVDQTQFLVNNGEIITQDDGIDVWLSTYSPIVSDSYANPWSGGLTVYWGTSTDSCLTNPPQAAALEIILLEGSKDNPTAERFAVDPCTRDNGFAPSAVGATIGGVSFPYSFHVTGITSGLIMRIIPLYSNTVMGIKPDTGTPAFPSQGEVIVSKGSSGTTQRQIMYFQGYDSLPSELYYSLFAQ